MQLYKYKSGELALVDIVEAQIGMHKVTLDNQPYMFYRSSVDNKARKNDFFWFYVQTDKDGKYLGTPKTLPANLTLEQAVLRGLELLPA